MTKDYRNTVFSRIIVGDIEANHTELAAKICETLSHQQCHIRGLQIIGTYFTFPNQSKKVRVSNGSYPDNIGLFPLWGDFAKALSENKSLEKLNLRGNYFTHSQFESILNVLNRMQNLKKIDFSSCKLLDEKRQVESSGYYSVASDSEGFLFMGIEEIVHNIQSLETVMLNNLNINATCMQRLIGNLKDSSVTKLGVRGNVVTPEIGEDIVKLLVGGKTFKELDLTSCRWEGFGFSKYASYEMAKRIGMAGIGKIDRFGLDSSYGDSHSPYDIDYRHYNPTWAFTGDLVLATTAVVFIGGNVVLFLGVLSGKINLRF